MFKKMKGDGPKPLPGDKAGAADKDKDDADDEEEPSGGEKEGGPTVLVLSRIIVNLEGPHKNAMLRCELHILFRDKELAKAACSDKATEENSQIRYIVNKGLSGKTLEEVMDVESKELIRTDIKDKLNEAFANRKHKDDKKKHGKPIKDVLIVDWAVQQ
jgi:flagellar basal body-associated protein FliL